MQQRRLRLGDIVDDYCPRERRITNHAIVAMVEDQVKHTRCTTCDADHEYKQAKVPVRRKKDAPPALHGDALAGVPRKRVAADGEPVVEASPEPVDTIETEAPAVEQPQTQSAAPETLDTPDTGQEPPAAIEDDGPVHRPLIRATLPRPEGQVPERKIPEFTAHQRGDMNGNRPGRGPRRGPRPGQVRGPHQGSGTGPSRFGGPRHGQGTRQGSGAGPRHGSPQGQRPSGGRTGHGQQGQPGQQRQGRPGGGRKRGR